MTPDTRLARLERIWWTVCDIPEGAVASYGDVAEIAGLPRGARLVGHALKRLPEGHPAPWWRVLRSGGDIAFPRGTPQRRRQAERLRAEGVVVRDGRVDMRRYRWRPGVDRLLWKPPAGPDSP